MVLFGLALSIGLIGVGWLLFLAENVLYFARVGWYYRLGPALRREEWQTAGTPGEVVTALGAALRTSKASSRAHGGWFALRRPWWVMSFWFRVRLRVEARPQGAAVVCEVRPFLTGPLFVVPLLVLIPTTYAMVWWLALLPVALAAAAVGAYLLAWPWERRQLHRLTDPLVAALAPLGVRICPACRYDLHRLPPEAPCPECGAASATQDHDPPALRHRASR